jgi:UDP-N-acetylglucosamine 2-epimerase
MELETVLAVAIELRSEQDGELIVLYPNNDAGHGDVLEVLEARESGDDLRVFRSLRREDYLDLLAHARVLIGNSSSGIIESASLGLPVINVGTRQSGRERNGNVVDTPPTRSGILEAAHRVFHDADIQESLASRASVYGDGRASERIVGAVGSLLGVEVGEDPQSVQGVAACTS